MFAVLSEIWLHLSPQTLLLFMVVFLLAYNYLNKQPWRRLPPGPPVLPLVGSVPFLGFKSDIRAVLQKLAAKYGDVFSFHMGTRRVVVLNGYDTIKDALVKYANAFSGRPDLFFLAEFTEFYGIVGSNGFFWKEQRRHAMHVLRDLGLGRSIIEERILGEVDVLIKELHKQVNKPYYPKPILQKSLCNVIYSVLCGKRRDYDDPQFQHHMDILSYGFENIASTGVLNVFPYFRHLPGDMFGMKLLKRYSDHMLEQYRLLVKEHKENFDITRPPSDFIDAYLIKMEEEKGNPDTTYSERQLLGIIGDLFSAGTDTTSTTLNWAIIYMVLNPEIQDRVQAEIDSVLDITDVPSMMLKTQLPLTEACICELQRIADIVPLSVPHNTTEDVYFRNYFIPKNTMIMPNLNSVHMDPNIWPYPEKFNPDRFLDDDKKLVKIENLIPFSIGKRACLGESLARMELFLYFVTMMKHFRFKVAVGHPPPDLNGRFSITYAPNKYNVEIESRF